MYEVKQIARSHCRHVLANTRHLHQIWYLQALLIVAESNMMSRRLLNVTMGAARQCLSSLRVIKYKPDCPMLTVDTYLQHPGTCTNYGRKLPKAHCRHFLAIPGTCTNYWCRETVLIVADSNVVSRISKFSLSQLPGTCSDPVY